MNVRACVYGFFVVILCAERDRGDRLKNKSNKQKKIIVFLFINSKSCKVCR